MENANDNSTLTGELPRTKEEFVLQVLKSGTTATRDVVAKLSEAGVEVAPNYVDGIRAAWRRGEKPETIRDGVVRRTPRAAKAPHAIVTTAAHRGRAGDKKAKILALYEGGVLEPAKIHEALKAEGVEVTMNYIYMLLGEAKKGKAGQPARKPQVAKRAAPEKRVETATAPRETPPTGIDANLLHLMQAAGLKYGIRAVTEAAQFVDRRSAQLIAHAFSA